MALEKNHRVKLVQSITQVLDGIRWDGTPEALDAIGDMLGSECDVSMSERTLLLDVILPGGRTKQVQAGNYVCLNEHGEVVFLTSERAHHRFTVIDSI